MASKEPLSFLLTHWYFSNIWHVPFQSLWFLCWWMPLHLRSIVIFIHLSAGPTLIYSHVWFTCKGGGFIVWFSTLAIVIEAGSRVRFFMMRRLFVWLLITIFIIVFWFSFMLIWFVLIIIMCFIRRLILHRIWIVLHFGYNCLIFINSIWIPVIFSLKIHYL